MTVLNLRQQPLQGTALYNPHLQGKNELLSLFVVRQKLLDLLLEDLRATDAGKSPQHHLILGQRGMGKTMLLRRLGYAIEDDPILRDRWLPLTFPEEQYNIARLSDFWLNCIDSLSDLLEGQGRHEEAEDLDDRAAALRASVEEQRSRQALGLLITTARNLGKRLVLLVDNVDLIFDRVREQEWALREILSTEPALVMIGASANAIESSFAYDQPFYDFFRVHELEGLSFEETREFLLRYAETWGAPEVRRIAEQEPGRIKVLHTLTGGNPRTIVLLFNVLAMGAEGDVRTDLERLLDQSTPLYKARFEALSTQAQQIVHAMAVRWDPISAGELAQDLGWDVNVISSQLNRLVKQGTVEKVDYDPESKTGFQIAERFFNIWYLMRASRRLRRRLIWLVEFLKVFYTQDELRTRAALHLRCVWSLEPAERLRYAEYSFALADAITDGVWRSSLEKTGLHAILKDDTLRGRLAELIDLEESEPALKVRVTLQERLEQAKSKVISTKLDLPDWSGVEFWEKLRDSLQLPLEGKVWVAENLPEFELERIEKLTISLDSEEEILRNRYVCPQIIESLTKAAQCGLMTGPSDVEGAIHAESILGTSGLEAIALANKLDFGADATLLPVLSKRLRQTTSPFPWLVWIRRNLEAKEGLAPVILNEALEKAVALASGNESIIVRLGETLAELNHLAEAEKVIRQFLARNAGGARAWTYLCFLLIHFDRWKEAEHAARRAIDLDSERFPPWANLSVILGATGRHVEAENACRKALDLNPGAPGLWINLGASLKDLNRISEAEEAYRKALNLAPDSSWMKRELAWVLLLNAGDFEAAGKLAREIQDDEQAAGIISTVLARKGDWISAAAEARRFITAVMEKDSHGKWPRTLAFFQEAARAGKAREVVDILEETGAAERWRPLREALEAIARGSESYLRRVAPEIRPAARELFKRLQVPVSEEPTRPRRRTSKSRKGDTEQASPKAGAGRRGGAPSQRRPSQR